MANLYDDVVMDHIKNARNFRAMIGAQNRLNGSNPLCGDEITLFLNLKLGQIEQVTFQAECCGIAMASTSIMTEMITGKNKEYVADVLKKFIVLLDERGTLPVATSDLRLKALLETVKRFPLRISCAALPWGTLASAIHEGTINWQVQ